MNLFLYSGDINVEGVKQDVFSDAKAKPYVHLANWQYPVGACLLGASAAMAPWAVFSKEQMESAPITRFIVFVLTASGLLVGPRLGIKKRLDRGKMSIAELYEPMLNNKYSLKQVSMILAGTCYVAMEGIILIFLTPADQA